METNFSLTKNEVDSILKTGSFRLEEYNKEIKDLNLKNIDKTSTFIHFNSFKTIRYEKKDFSNLLVLDQTTFQNNAVDYELEVEGKNAKDAKKYFLSVLSDYSIPSRKSLAKIARAEQNK